MVPPGVLGPGVVAPPLRFEDLLESRFWEARFYQPEDFLWQPTLFQPVGGMDMIVEGFKRKIGSLIVHNAEVVHIRNQSDRVRVTVQDTVLGHRSELEADYCISNIPLPVLSGIEDDGTFTRPFKRAVDSVPFANTCKVGWQAQHRFWESSGVENQAYGGISWTDHPITQIWYPSNDYFSETGTLTGAYNFGETAERFGNLGLEERLDLAMAGGELMHPGQFRQNVPIELGLSIAWQQVPHQLGGWADWDRVAEMHGEQGASEIYGTLLDGDGRFQGCGDQLSYLSGWQEGAILSAHFATQHLVGVTEAAVPEIRSVPRTRRLTGETSG